MNTRHRAAAAAGAASPRRWALRISGITLLVCLFALLVGAAALLQLLEGVPVQLMVNGEHVSLPLPLAQLGGGEWLTLVAALTVAAVALVLVVPVLLLAVGSALLLALGAALALGLGLPLLILALVAVLLVSPLALLGWMLWRALRPAPTMPA